MQLQRHLHIRHPWMVLAWVTSWHHLHIQLIVLELHVYTCYARSRCVLQEVSNL